VFDILRNPENNRRAQLAKVDGRKSGKELRYERLTTCHFVDNENCTPWKAWRFLFRNAILAVLAKHCDCGGLLTSNLKESEGYTTLISEWINEIKLDFERLLRTHIPWLIPDDLPEKAIRLYRLIPLYNRVDFTTSTNQEHHFVRFRHPFDYPGRDIPRFREFQVSSPHLAQIAELYSILNPFEMMVDLAKSQWKFPSITGLSKVEKSTLFTKEAARYISKNDALVQKDLSEIALHAFNLWWFYQTHFHIKFAENLIAEREREFRPPSKAPTLQGRRVICVT
jgi:hypothetical protein